MISLFNMILVFFMACRKKNGENDESVEEGEVKEDDVHPLASISNINPDEIPDVPVNKFLLRGDATNNDKRAPIQRGNSILILILVLFYHCKIVLYLPNCSEEHI